MTAFANLIIDVSTLSEALTADPNAFVLLDVRPQELYSAAHIAHALHLDPALLNRSAPPQVGLLPTADTVQNWASQLGLSQDSTIVVYDDGKATPAARALWVMHAYGFTNVHWLNGGMQAWMAQGNPTTTDAAPSRSPNTSLQLSLNSSVVISKEALLENLSTPNNGAQKRKAIDARTSGEFAGTDVRSERGGHLPGAVHYEWLSLFTDAGTLKPEAQLQEEIKQLGVQANDACVVYCQSHQRSAVTYVVLKHFGFNDVTALDGAWSNWGNDPSTPVEI